MRIIFAKAVEVSRKVHSNMIKRVIRAPCNLFFDRVPIGRLINRFSGDLSSIDEGFVYNFGTTAFSFIGFIGAILVCFYLGTVWVFFVSYIFYRLTKHL